MKWHYDGRRRWLVVTSPALEDQIILRALIRHHVPARNIEAIIYETPAFTLIIRGPLLRRWIAEDPLQAIMDKYGLSVT